jgi:hypothetical protein
VPLIAAAFIVHAAGLLLGFGGLFLSGIVVAAVAGVWATLRRDGRSAALALLGAAGVLRATAATAADAQCARRAVAWDPVSDARVVSTAVLETDARPRARS